LRGRLGAGFWAAGFVWAPVSGLGLRLGAGFWAAGFVWAPVSRPRFRLGATSHDSAPIYAGAQNPQPAPGRLRGSLTLTCGQVPREVGARPVGVRPMSGAVSSGVHVIGSRPKIPTLG